MNLKSVILFIVFYYALHATAAASENVFSDYRINIKNMLMIFHDAVELNTVYQVYEDKKGFTWFATENGLIRFDGYKLKYFLPDPCKQKINCRLLYN